MYDTVEYAQFRINNTIIRDKNGSPIHIMSCYEEGGEIFVKFIYLTDVSSRHTSLLTDCDLRPVPLGYVNQNSGSYYLSRQPLRADWRQGLRVQNTSMHYLPDHRQLHNCIMGVYPTINQILYGMDTYGEGAAFSRRFSVAVLRLGSAYMRLSYKGKPCGYLNISDLSFQLDSDKTHLKEVLQEDLNADDKTELLSKEI